MKVLVLGGAGLMGAGTVRDLLSARSAGVEAVVVAGRRIPVASSHEDVGESGLVAVINSYDLLEVSAGDGSAAAVLGVQTGEPVERGGG